MERFRSLLREYLLPLCIVVMWAGMMWSRAILSMGMMAFGVGALLLTGPAVAWNTVRRERALQGMVLLFMIPACTFFWSVDKATWLESMYLKAPFLLAPFGVAAWREVPQSGRVRMWNALLIVSILTVLESLWLYANHAAEVNASYLRGSVLRVAMDDDHVRYGWALAIIYAYVLDRVMPPRDMSPRARNLHIATLVLLGVFLVLLASRTGWLGLLLAHGWSFWKHDYWRGKPRLRFGLPLLAILVLPFIPSLVNRLKFTLWDFQHYSRGGYAEGLNDTPRVISWQAGVDLWKTNPLSGVGAGDLVNDLQAWYPAHHPEMPRQEWLRPSNEWLYHGAMAGVPGLILFCIALWLMYRRKDGSMVWNTAATLALVGFLYELGLESQFGVFLFAFTMIIVDATFVPCLSQRTYKP